jgi:non-heme chloroperoxidase
LDSVGYIGRHGAGRAKGRVAKAVLIGAVPPLMLKTPANAGGLPLEVFDGFRAALLADRAQFSRDVPTGPFYGFNRPGAKVSQGLIDNWWRQGMMCGVKAAYDCIKAFSESDFTEDLKKIAISTLVIHGDDDQVVPIGASAMLSSKPVTLEGAGVRLDLPGLLARDLCNDVPARRHSDRLSAIRSSPFPPAGDRGAVAHPSRAAVHPLRLRERL